MLRRRDYLLGSIGLGIAALGGGSLAAPARESVRAALRQTVGSHDAVAGTVAIVIDESGQSMVAYGSSGVPNVALDELAVFELGSITKVMTALLLADMAARGEVALDDPLAEYLPPSVKLNERARQITLRDLAGYNAGLPKFPGNLPADWYLNPNPFANYTTDSLHEAISSFAPQWGADRPFVYSSFGFGLLGVALARRGGKSYEKLLIERVCAPLGLSHTRITLPTDMQDHMVQPHDLNLKPTPFWDFSSALQGAGGARANVADATAFLKACMGIGKTSLRGAVIRTLETRRPTTLPGTQAALGWFISSDGNEEIAWKSGLTGGCNTFIGFSTKRRCGAFVLSNFVWQPIDVGTTLMGMKFIDSDFAPGDLALLYR